MIRPFAPHPALAALAIFSLATLHGAEPAPAPLEVAGLRNAYRVSARIVSGSQPEGDAAFAGLAALGVRTIVSVDGARPDVAGARKFGLRYIHLPLGYDGIPAAQVPQLARAATIAPGVIYVHCHHGKHRGPAAAAVMCEAAEGWSRERAETWLRQAGTAEEYAGLYRAVREFQAPTGGELARVGDLPEVAETPAVVDAMVALDERLDALTALQKVGWKAAGDQSDIPPAQQATLLWEYLRELARTEDTRGRPEDYRVRLAASERAAESLRDLLHAPAPDAAQLDAALATLAQRCTDCHKAHRNQKR